MPPKLGPQQVPGEAIWRLAGGAYSDRPRLLAGGRRIAAPSPRTPHPLSALWASDFGPSALVSDPK